MLEGLKRIFEKPKDEFDLEKERREKDLKEFKAKIQTPEYQEKISKIISEYNLGSNIKQSIHNGYIGKGSELKKFLTMELKSFSEEIFDIIRNKKPPIIIGELDGGQDDVGRTGNIFIPVDDEIMIYQHSYVLGYCGIEYSLDKKLGYRELKPKNADDFDINKMGWPTSMFIVAYELKGNTDRSLLTTNIDPKWKFE